MSRDGTVGRSRTGDVARVVAALVALAMIAAALLVLAAANAGVDVSHTRLGPTPVSVFRPSDGAATLRPVVVISHGFAGSQQLMQPFAVTMARNGYLAVTFDYLGHGRNLEPLGGDVNDVEGSTRLLLEQTGKVVDYALALPDAGSGLAVLGHSMASDVVVRYAQEDPRVDATIAVSLFSPAVTAESPPNLLVIVGDWEGYLKQEAMRVLGQVTASPSAGVTYGSFRDGSARRAVFADGVEHVAVLYSPESMRESVNWLQSVFPGTGAAAAGDDDYIDDRGGAIVLLFAGLGLLGWPLARLLPRVTERPAGASLDWGELRFAAIVPAVVTPLLLWWFPADFLSVLVGGYLGVHFGVYGLVTAACLWWVRRRRYRRGRAAASPRDAAAEEDDEASRAGASSKARSRRLRPGAAVLATILATAYTAGAIALALDAYVTSFVITPPRLPLLLVMLAGTLSYFLADEWMTRGEGTPSRAHAFTRLCFLFSLGLAVALSFAELFFLLIIAVIILVYFLIYGLFGSWIYRATGHPVVGAVASAVAFAWALAVVFPMLSG